MWCGIATMSGFWARPPVPGSLAHAVNSAGVVAGSGQISGVSASWVYRDEAFTTLSAPETGAMVVDMNDRGDILGRN